MTHSADIKRVREDLKILNRNSLSKTESFENLIQFDTEIEIKSFWKIQGELKTHSQRLAKLIIYSHMITQKELEVLLESLKMVYMKHEDGEVKMLVKQNHEYINC